MSWCSAFSHCCKWCKEEEKSTSYSGAKYKKVKQDINIILHQCEKVPMQKTFEFKQPPLCPLSAHPPLFCENSQCVIDQQPSFTSHASETNKIFDDQPQIHFSLYYDFQRCTLRVHLISGLNFQTQCMAVSHRRATRAPPDLFVIVFLRPNKEQIFESKISKKSNNPIFEDYFEFTRVSYSEVRKQTLIFRVINKSKSTNDDVGIVALSLQDADLYGIKVTAELTQEKSVLNSDFSNGDILISIMYDPSAQSVIGMLLKATNLKKMDVRGSSDPYVKIFLYYRGNKIYKWKSSIKKGTLVPVYNEKFEFSIMDMDVHCVSLYVVVADHDIMGTNDVIGMIDIGEGSIHPTGQLQWTEMISAPHTPISFWHIIPKPAKTTLKRLTKRKATWKNGNND